MSHAVAVMVVFSGTEVGERLFRAALDRARATGARLVLLDVRHLRQAERLGDYLTSESVLGRGAVAAVRAAVKDQRDRAIRRALEELEREARRHGVEIERCQVKGTYADAVAAAARDHGASVVVVEAGPESARLSGPFEVVQV